MRKKLILSLFLSFIFALLPYYKILSGEFVGYPALKWGWVNYEHWYQVLQGNSQIRDLNIFYPYNMSLGFSDSFVIQGLIYTTYRFLFESRELALVMSNLTLAVFFSLGIFKIGQLVLKNTTLSLIFNFLVMTSYFFSITLGGAQTAGYALAVWTIYFEILAFNTQNSFQIRNKNFNLFIVCLPLLALSTWYAAFFIIVLSIIFYFIKNIFDLYNIRLSILFTVQYLSNYRNIIYILISLFLWICFFWIYLPVKDIPIRTWDEVISYLPRLIDFVNAKGLGGGFLKDLYNLQIFSNGNYGGVTPILLILFIILLLKKQKFTNFEKVFFITFIFWFIIILKFNNNYSFYYLLWNYIPGFKSIRDPSRAMLIFHIGMILLLLKYYSQILLNKKIIYFISGLVLIFFEQIRFEQPSYNLNNYLIDKKEKTNIQDIQKESCRSIFFLRNGFGWWKDQIDGMVFANYYGLDSVNGYSGGLPPKYPDLNAELPGSFNEIVDWIYANNVHKNICIFDETRLWNLLNDNFYPPLEGTKDLYSKESNKNGFWYWTKKKNISIQVIALGNKTPNKKFVATVINNPCNNASFVQILLNNKKYDFQIKKELKITLSIKNPNERINSVSIQTDAKACSVEDDERKLFFQIRNVKLS